MLTLSLTRYIENNVGHFFTGNIIHLAFQESGPKSIPLYIIFNIIYSSLM